MTTTATNDAPILLAFSGGLDTSFCIPWLRDRHGRPVITVTVDTGGIDAGAAADLARRSRALGAIDHVLVDAKSAFFDRVLRYLLFGNVRRGQVYPLCVGAERVVQAAALADVARERGAGTVAHGCTAAGNDQVRFEVALRALAPGLEVLAPVRDEGFVREEQVAYLRRAGLPVPERGSAYSINRGLWGVTIGGQETLGSEDGLPESAWVLSADAFSSPRPPVVVRVGFTAGVPTSLDGRDLAPVAIIEALEASAGPLAIGRGIHLGETILGTKGRVAFEAPAAEVLLTAHRELEKLVLTGPQQRVKDQLAAEYGDLVHEGRHLEPVCRDIEAFLVSSQQRVTGDVRMTLRPGSVAVDGVRSPYSLMAASRGAYGERTGEWTPADALGFSRIRSVPGVLHARAGELASGDTAP